MNKIVISDYDTFTDYTLEGDVINIQEYKYDWVGPVKETIIHAKSIDDFFGIVQLLITKGISL